MSRAGAPRGWPGVREYLRTATGLHHATTEVLAASIRLYTVAGTRQAALDSRPFTESSSRMIRSPGQKMISEL